MLPGSLGVSVCVVLITNGPPSHTPVSPRGHSCLISLISHLLSHGDRPVLIWCASVVLVLCLVSCELAVLLIGARGLSGRKRVMQRGMRVFKRVSYSQ